MLTFTLVVPYDFDAPDMATASRALTDATNRHIIQLLAPGRPDERTEMVCRRVRAREGGTPGGRPFVVIDGGTL